MTQPHVGYGVLIMICSIIKIRYHLNISPSLGIKKKKLVPYYKFQLFLTVCVLGKGRLEPPLKDRPNNIITPLSGQNYQGVPVMCIHAVGYDIVLMALLSFVFYCSLGAFVGY